MSLISWFIFLKKMRPVLPILMAILQLENNWERILRCCVIAKIVLRVLCMIEYMQLLSASTDKCTGMEQRVVNKLTKKSGWDFSSLWYTENNKEFKRKEIFNLTWKCLSERQLKMHLKWKGRDCFPMSLKLRRQILILSNAFWKSRKTADVFCVCVCVFIFILFSVVI